MNFSQALESVKTGDIAYREGWNTKESFIELKSSPYLITENPKTGEDTLRTSKSFIHFSDENGNYAPWTPTQDDLLSEDWTVIASLTVKNKTTEENESTTDESSEGEEFLTNFVYIVMHELGYTLDQVLKGELNSSKANGFSKRIADRLKRQQGLR